MPETIVNTDHLKALRCEEMRRLVLKIEALREEKKEAVNGFNMEIEDAYARLKALALTDDSQFEMKLEPVTGDETTD